MRFRACALFDSQRPCGAQANMAKYLAAKASWEAANVCLQTYGGYGFASEYDVERKFRETRLYQVAPISTNMIFAYVAACGGRPRLIPPRASFPHYSLRVLRILSQPGWVLCPHWGSTPMRYSPSWGGVRMLLKDCAKGALFELRAIAWIRCKCGCRLHKTRAGGAR